jgi:Putative lumazine-binding
LGLVIGLKFIFEVFFCNIVLLKISKMKKLLCIISLFFIIQNANAQTAEESIKSTISTFFSAMYASDTLLMHSVMHPKSTLYSVNISRGKPSKLDETAMPAFYKVINTKRPGVTLEERLLEHKIMIDEDLATDWTPYEFYVNSKLSHKGTNVFTLVKLDGKWQITAIIDTRKR